MNGGDWMVSSTDRLRALPAVDALFRQHRADEVEQALLGALLLDRRAYGRTVGRVTAERSFHSPRKSPRDAFRLVSARVV